MCLAARGDYMRVPPWTTSFEEVMKPIDGANMDEKIANFLRQLMLAGHWGPFEHPVITLGIEGMSRVTLAQITRHRISSFDIQSGRVARMEAEKIVWPPSLTEDVVTSRGGGRVNITLPREERQRLVEGILSAAFKGYKALIEGGIPEEDARYILPEAVTVHGHMTLNARSLMHVIAIRSFGDAQWEVRELAGGMLERAREWMPVAFRLFEDEWMSRRDVLGP